MKFRPHRPAAANDAAPFWGRLKYFLTPIDGRYEDLLKGNLGLNILRDFTAGLIVAMVAIPLAMGFAMASGLRPEQGIVGGAIAGMIGALWGGSKYQVYGPTAAFIPVIAGLMAKYDHSVLVLASLICRHHSALASASRAGGESWPRCRTRSWSASPSVSPSPSRSRRSARFWDSRRGCPPTSSRRSG